MYRIFSRGLFTLVFFFFANQALADPADGACEILNELDASPGLYGLCVAYHNANENAQARILENYLKKMGEGDPGMPGLASCPCWDAESLDQATAGLTLFNCGTTETPGLVFDFLWYTNGFQLATLNLGEGVMYFCAVGGATVPVATPEQDEVCRNLLAQHEPECVFD